MYILSSEEAYQKFITNPRPYLLPPMPRFPCRVCIIGPPQAGTTTLCRLLAQSYNALVLDVDELLKPVLSKEEQERIDKIKEEATLLAIDMVKRNIEEGIEQTSGKFSVCLCLKILHIFNMWLNPTIFKFLQTRQILKKVSFQSISLFMFWLCTFIFLFIHFLIQFYLLSSKVNLFNSKKFSENAHRIQNANSKFSPAQYFLSFHFL